MPESRIDFFSSDPAANPLLDIGLRPDLFGAWLVLLGAILVAGFSYASFCDLWRGRLTPNWFTHGIIAFALAAGPLLYEGWVTNFVIGGVMGLVFGLLWRSGGIGMGDVKLFTGLGLLFGPAGILIVALSQMLSVVIALPVALLSGRGRKMPVPMFPFAAAATLLVLAALGAPAGLVLAGAGLLGAACAFGIIERRLWPPAGLADLAAPVLAGECAAVRLRPLERPIRAGENGEWGEPAGGPRVRRRDLDVLSHALLDHEQIATLDRVGEVSTRVSVGGGLVRVRFAEGLDGYTLDVHRDGERPEGVPYAPPLPPLAATS